MLNELYTLARSLKRFNVMVEAAHPWVKRLGRADLLVAGVDAAGFVATVEYADKQTAVSLFKIQESNHSNFPAVNWPSPVWKLDREAAAVQEWLACPAEQLRLRGELLRKACGAADISPGQDRALSRVQEFCRELTPRFQVSDDREFAAFSTLLERLLAVTTSAEEWLRRLSDSALGCAEAGSAEMLVLVETLLAGKFDRKKDQLQKAKVPILFDLADCTEFRHRVASPKFGGYFSQRLNATDIAGTDGGRCALTGLDMPIQTDKMPSPRLPVLGDTVLMSMNPDTPCQTRYGRIGTEIFPLGERTASDLNSALLHLTTEGRKRKNWMPVPGTTKKKFNLLLVYLEASPLLEADIAEMFSGAEESDALYTTICARVSEALRGRATRESDLLHLFVLNKIDPGRVQVELDEAFTAEQVIRGGAEWEEGSRNRPALVLQGDDFVPSPTDVMKCLRMKWERSGASYSEAPGCRLADVYQLLIAETERAPESANHVLRMTLHRSADLLKAAGHAAHRGGKEAWKSISRDAGKNPIIAASLLGITLNKLGYRKENYMHEPAFLIGRFLSLADTLHAEYSKSVRDDLPPQLLGNALIPTAISSPNKGLARMLQRIRVYQAWARGKKGTGLARWSCGEMGKIANEVAGKMPARLSEAEQAQLLLGYLARAESNQEKASEEGANQ
jgi:hypothetical protein